MQFTKGEKTWTQKTLTFNCTVCIDLTELVSSMSQSLLTDPPAGLRAKIITAFVPFYSIWLV